MTGPRRVQRTRKAGQPGMPEGAKYVGRGSRFGNPFRVDEALEAGMADSVADARKYCTDLFRAWITGEGPYGPKGCRWSREEAERMRAALPELRGLDLACWCPIPEPGQPDHCHASVELELANAPKET